VGEIWQGGGDISSPPACQISPSSVQRVAPAGRRTLKFASEKIKYRRLALRAMLPVIKTIGKHGKVVKIHFELECGPLPNVMAAQPKYVDAPSAKVP